MYTLKRDYKANKFFKYPRDISQRDTVKSHHFIRVTTDHRRLVAICCIAGWTQKRDVNGCITTHDMINI